MLKKNESSSDKRYPMPSSSIFLKSEPSPCPLRETFSQINIEEDITKKKERETTEGFSIDIKKLISRSNLGATEFDIVARNARKRVYRSFDD